MDPGESDQGRPAAKRAADMLKGRGMRKLAQRQAKYRRLRSILSEKFGELVAPAGFGLDLDGERRLVLLAESNAHAELLRQCEPDIRAALAPEGIDEVRVRVNIRA